MKRLFQNWVTSIFGLLLLGYTAYQYVTIGLSNEQLLFMLGLGFLLLRAKDSLIWLKPKG